MTMYVPKMSDSESGSRPGMLVILVPTSLQSQPWAELFLERLSRREREILPMLAARWSDREIADALCISYRTVTTHVTHIFDKLGINSRREAAAFAWTFANPGWSE